MGGTTLRRGAGAGAYVMGIFPCSAPLGAARGDLCRIASPPGVDVGSDRRPWRASLGFALSDRRGRLERLCTKHMGPDLLDRAKRVRLPLAPSGNELFSCRGSGNIAAQRSSL